ncbi:MAG: GIY-YIG nuclease superfamily protein [Candidatus Daviesbacteria bacterium GW2011_GWA1_41_61]|nr:MAG: GIY-YIG nuclease superfamily protein [Candidatus Daviesbacteria bacterium GW2011_GWC1_40_9]KKR92748.1 MAG: GIY-YIG nuclease superfamily protein [Candidatus Daviesbacteria bacterium GW2011_GWB1_41_15]KKS14507.1 MAG: GIY-YIG nuclease superfamily protein [Candidatus Daviesbacteria bacterium GW2011_GWA1_41_61]
MNKYYVYLLKSLKDGNYYIGQTDNIEKRLKNHNAGYNKSTKYRVPLILIGYEEYPNQSLARWREYELKHSAHKRQKLISHLIEK